MNQPVGVPEFFTTRRRRLGDRQLVLVHQADDGVGVFGLGDDAAKVAPPLADLQPASRFVILGIDAPQVRMKPSVAGVSDHRRTVGGGAPGDEDVGAGGKIRRDENRQAGSENDQDAGVRFHGTSPCARQPGVEIVPGVQTS